MTKVRLKYLHCFADRHGQARYYFRYRGQLWPIAAPGTEGFATAYDALLARVKANPFAIRRNVEFMPGSLGWAIERFLGSPQRSQFWHDEEGRGWVEVRQQKTGTLRSIPCHKALLAELESMPRAAETTRWGARRATDWRQLERHGAATAARDGDQRLRNPRVAQEGHDRINQRRLHGSGSRRAIESRARVAGR
jgi:hypothetical protein